MKKVSFTGLLGDQAFRIKTQSELGLLNIPSIPNGKEKYRFDEGDEVFFSKLCPYRGSGIVEDRYMQNGYCYYMVGSLTLRDKDLI